MFFGIIFFVFIFFILTPYDHSYYRHHETRNRPLDILNERFVNGEIDEKEYLAKKNILRK